jgi:DNA-binding transcriptional MerR regulator
MPWSTQQLADLAGSTVKAIRYYHRIGVLEEPERGSNGYKHYDTAHLVRLLQIKRLGELGFSLDQVEDLARPGEDPATLVRDLDAELAATIVRLTEVREELAALLEHRAPVYVPPGFASISREMSETQRSLLLVYAAVLSPEAMADFGQMIAVPAETDDDFRDLPADASPEQIEALAQRMVPVVQKQHTEHPMWAGGLDPLAPRGARLAADTMAQAIADLHNPAQMATIRRLAQLLGDQDIGSS